MLLEFDIDWLANEQFLQMHVANWLLLASCMEVRVLVYPGYTVSYTGKMQFYFYIIRTKGIMVSLFQIMGRPSRSLSGI